MVTVQTEIKAHLKELRLGSDYKEELDRKVVELIEDSIIRAKANKRLTVYAKDV